MNVNTKKYYPVLDYCKLLCALLVIAIHCWEIKKGEPIATILVYGFSSQAVPFFFLVSGFFLGKGLKKSNLSKDYIKKYSFRLLYLYFAWILLWTPQMLITYLERYPDKSLLYILIVLVRRIVFAGYGVYWYLLVLLESCIIIWFLLRKKATKLLFAIASLGMIFGLLYEFNINFPFSEFLYKITYTLFSWDNNVIMKGLPYVTLGVVFSYYEKTFEITKKYLIIFYTLISILNIIFFFQTAIAPLYPLQALLLFLFGLQFTKEHLDSKAVLARELSEEFYFMHTVFIYLVVNKLFGVGFLFELKYLVTVLLCTLTFFVIKRLNWKPLNWLMNFK